MNMMFDGSDATSKQFYDHKNPTNDSLPKQRPSVYETLR